MSDVLYRKVGKRYVKVGLEHIGFPATGVWLVTQGEGMRSERVFTQLGEPPSIMTYAAFERHRDVIARTIAHFQSQPYTFDSVAGQIIKAVCLAEESEVDKKHRTKENI